MLTLSTSIVPVALYAETHFRFFRLFPNLLFRKMPEVVFDLPRRIDPGRDLPVLLLLNDADRFSARCRSVKVSITRRAKRPLLFTFDTIKEHAIAHPLAGNGAAYVFRIPARQLDPGIAHINCAATLLRNGKTVTVLNDNLVGSSKFPFTCFLAEERLPGNAVSSLGDVHVHSRYSQSHVEFGPPLAVIDEFSMCYGNDFVVVTDHSYDLACSMDNYLRPDSSLPRWNRLRDEISNTKLRNIVVLGEEVSCLNARGKVIHLCAMGLQSYLPGTLDGGRRGSGNAMQLRLEEAIAEVHAQQGVAFAAHPGSNIGFMQRIFLKRGNWRQKDYSTSLDGIQGINNGFGKSWQKAKTLWIKELLKGHKLSLAAGNDSHGDFNRYRFLSIPFVSIAESFNRFFSYAMTGIYGKIGSQHDVIHALKHGKTYATTGPFLCLGFSDSPLESIVSTSEITISKKSIAVTIISTKEFGLPWRIRLYCGELHKQKETCLFNKVFQGDQYSICENLSNLPNLERGYLRAEAECRKTDGELAYAATSPCYFCR